jgi:hypothetical protein
LYKEHMPKREHLMRIMRNSDSNDNVNNNNNLCEPVRPKQQRDFSSVSGHLLTLRTQEPGFSLAMHVSSSSCDMRVFILLGHTRCSKRQSCPYGGGRGRRRRREEEGGGGGGHLVFKETIMTEHLHISLWYDGEKVTADSRLVSVGESCTESTFCCR